MPHFYHSSAQPQDRKFAAAPKQAHSTSCTARDVPFSDQAREPYTVGIRGLPTAKARLQKEPRPLVAPGVGNLADKQKGL